MGRIKSQFPVGSFFLKMCGDEQGVIHFVTILTVGMLVGLQE